MRPLDHRMRTPSRMWGLTALQPLANSVIIPRKSAWQTQGGSTFSNRGFDGCFYKLILIPLSEFMSQCPCVGI